MASLFFQCIHVIRIDDPGLVSSRDDNWQEKGREFFGRQLYEDAARCFERAHDTQSCSIAKAFLARQNADNLRPEDPKRAQMYHQSGLAFQSSARVDAPRLEQKGLWSRAAECFFNGGSHLNAGRSYKEAESYDNCVSELIKAAAFDEAVDIIRSHRPSIQTPIVENAIEAAKMGYTEACLHRFVFWSLKSVHC